VYPSVRARTKFINSLYTYNFDIGRRRFTGFGFVWLYKMKDLLKIDWNQRGPRKSSSTFSPAILLLTKKKKSLLPPFNAAPSPTFLPRLEKRLHCLPRVSKLFTLPLVQIISGFQKWF
jgi:hypothetical protein